MGVDAKVVEKLEEREEEEEQKEVEEEAEEENNCDKIWQPSPGRWGKNVLGPQRLLSCACSCPFPLMYFDSNKHVPIQAILSIGYRN